MNKTKDRDLASPPFLQTIAFMWAMVGFNLLPQHGVMGKWLGMGLAIGTIIFLIASWTGFRILFLCADHMNELKKFERLALFRIFWSVSFGVGLILIMTRL